MFSLVALSMQQHEDSYPDRAKASDGLHNRRGPPQRQGWRCCLADGRERMACSQWCKVSQECWREQGLSLEIKILDHEDEQVFHISDILVLNPTVWEEELKKNKFSKTEIERDDGKVLTPWSHYTVSLHLITVQSACQFVCEIIRNFWNVVIRWTLICLHLTEYTAS